MTRRELFGLCLAALGLRRTVGMNGPVWTEPLSIRVMRCYDAEDVSLRTRLDVIYGWPQMEPTISGDE